MLQRVCLKRTRKENRVNCTQWPLITGFNSSHSGLKYDVKLRLKCCQLSPSQPLSSSTFMFATNFSFRLVSLFTFAAKFTSVSRFTFDAEFEVVSLLIPANFKLVSHVRGQLEVVSLLIPTDFKMVSLFTLAVEFMLVAQFMLTFVFTAEFKLVSIDFHCWL